MITVNGLQDLEGNLLGGDNNVHIMVTAGDVDNVSPANGNDLSAVKLQLFKPVTSGNFRADVLSDGMINGDDLSEVKKNLFHGAVCP